MNKRIYFTSLLLFALLGINTLVTAKGKHPATGEPPKAHARENVEFIENKGQWTQEAKYKASVPGGALFLTNSGFVYSYFSQDDVERIHHMTDEGRDVTHEFINFHAYKVNFVGANPDVKFTNTDKRPNYNNYFIGNDQSKWASNVGIFGKVVQQNVYNGIDVAVYGKKNSLKYDFIVAPGASTDQIVLSFSGVQPTLTKEGNLSIKTSVNEIVEQAPYSYQIINGKEVAVPSRFRLNNGQLTFEFPEGYNKNVTLVIDPVLVFATYSGGTGGLPGFYSYSTTYDAGGNMYAGSGAQNAGWPTTLGAFQSAWSAGNDVGINKYNALGSALIYSTYFGGNGSDLPHAMIVNDQNEIIVAGSTRSSNIPTSPGAYDNAINGAMDIFVVHFNATGTGIIGSTYIGGSGSDPVAISFTGIGSEINQNTNSPVEVNFDDAGNIWVVGSTPSNDFPVTANAYQATNGGGNDGVLFQLNANCSQLLYSTYFGGNGDDAILAVQFNNANNIVLCGATQSGNFPTTAGALQTAPPGGTYDGFVSIFNPTTGGLLQSTYVGTDNTDQAVNIQIDETDNVYVLGRTVGNYPISAGVFNSPDGDVFIDKLSPTLSSSLLSTRLGNSQTAGRYFPTAFLHDICGNIYVAGLAANAGLPLTNDAFQTTVAPFWFGVLEPNFTGLLYGSYFGTGADHTHVGVNRLDPQGVVYHSICNNQQYPFTNSSSYMPNKQNTGQDIVSFKFDFEATGVNSNFQLDPAVNGNDTGCVPYTVKMQNNSTSAKEFVWDFGDGSPVSTDTFPTHTYTVPGVYTISLHANNDSSCITDDTSYMTITVLEVNLPDITVNDTTICSFEQAVNIDVEINNPSPNNTILWQPATGILTAPDQLQITVDPSVNNIYYVTVKDTIPGICGFSVTDTVHIDLSPRELDIINNDTVVCEGAILPISAVGTPGYTFRWTPAIGVSDTTALQPTITINQSNIYTLTGSYPNCPDTSVSISIDMHFTPHLDLGPDKFVCQWSEVTLESAITPYRNDYIYQWSPVTPNLNNPTGPNADFIADTTITYSLNVQTPIGCSDNDTIKVTVYPGAFGGAVSDTGYCPNPGSQAQLWASGGVKYAWTPAYGLSDTAIANPIASPLTSTDYTVYIYDIHNCVDTEFVSVAVYPQAVINLPDSVNVYPGEQYHLEPNTNCLYFQWFPPSGIDDVNSSNPKFSPEVRTRYFVTATTEYGCIVKDSLDILVKETVLDIPNAFVPSSNNSLFKPSKRGIAQLKNFTIFNRWGNKVFTTSNIDQGWDGTYNDKPQPAGVYIYTIEAVTDNGKTFTKQGNVTLIR
jgi:gliding motility-associated-like protein